MFQDFLNAIKNYTQAISLIKKLKLWRYFFIPAIISLFLTISISIIIFNFSHYFGDYISSIYPWDFGMTFITNASNIIGGLIIFGIGLVLYKHIVMALSAPFMSPLSEKIEEHISGISCTTPSMSNSLIRGLRINIRNMIIELLIVIPCTLLSFIPIIGIVFTIISFLALSYYAGFGNLDYTLERHLNYKNSIQFVRQNRPTAIGNGALYTLSLLIPFIGIIFILPISAAAATISSLEKLDIHPKKLHT